MSSDLANIKSSARPEGDIAPRAGAATSARDMRERVVIEHVQPRVDGAIAGEFPVKRCLGDQVHVEADVFADGHDALRCWLLCRPEEERDWHEAPMTPAGNDRWMGVFSVHRLGRYRFTIMACIDRFESWRRDLRKRADAGQTTSVDLQIGAALIKDAIENAHDEDEGDRLLGFHKRIERCASQHDRLAEGVRVSLDDELVELMSRWSSKPFAVRHEPELIVEVDRERAGFSTWYEVFPRSCAPGGDRHGTFRDLEARLPYIAGMGFDVLYLPPVHPIGRTNRKGQNNAKVAQPGDVGSPWAIGSEEGGHKSIHPQLGTLDDFQRLLAAANAHGMEVALDIAFQCSPDHPYLKEHPEWFRRRPDGTLQYAENPPKKYEDIYPFDFECEDWKSLWHELHSIFAYWIEQGVRIFRVDNPHTKPFQFWKWCIHRLKAEHPDVIMLSEAFTRPKVMKRLAKVGFTQSYTYFAWKNTAHELREYFTELTQSSMREYFRPNAWPNTPDILNEYLQSGGRPAFMSRLVLAATLSSNYGMYGPAYELCEHVPRELGSEEYLDSEKYQLRSWNLDNPASLREFIALVNRIRRENRALHRDPSLHFHNTDNAMLLSYHKTSPDLENIVIVVVNMDPHHAQSGWVEVPLDRLGMNEGEAYQVSDLLSGARYTWRDRWNYVELNPHVSPAHIFAVRKRVRTEQDFEYFV